MGGFWRWAANRWSAGGVGSESGEWGRHQDSRASGCSGSGARGGWRLGASFVLSRVLGEGAGSGDQKAQKGWCPHPLPPLPNPTEGMLTEKGLKKRGDRKETSGGAMGEASNKVQG